MATRGILDLLKDLTEREQKQPKRKKKTVLYEADTDTYSFTERDEIIKSIGIIPAKQRQVRLDDLQAYMRPISKNIAQSRYDNEKILKIAPEVKKARSIVIPSIMSPNDLRNSNVIIASLSKRTTPSVNKKVADYITNYFNETIELQLKLAEWIDTALYGAGSQPILILPISDLEKDIVASDKQAKQDLKDGLVAYESIKESVYGINTASVKKVKDDKKAIKFEKEDLVALENFIGSTVNDITDTNTNTKKSNSYNRDTSFAKIKEDYLAFATEALSDDSFSVVDNPDIIKVDQNKKNREEKRIKDTLVKKYRPSLMMNMSKDDKAKRVGNSIYIELPPESVIPIFSPGSPKDHLGYLVAIGDGGRPLVIADMTNEQNKISNLNNNRNTIASLYKSFGYEMPLSTSRQEDAAASIYGHIIDNYLKTVVLNGKMDNVNLGSDNGVYKLMYYRYLQAKKTRLVFIPKDMMIYFCDRYNADGTGKSKLDDIKFILAMRMTLMISRLLAAVNNSIDRRVLTVNLDGVEHGDPIQLINMIENMAIEKATMGYTYDPVEINRNIATKSLTIKSTGIPGIEAYKIENERNDRNAISPDEGLAEDIRNLLIMYLDVPPSAYNSLDENEYMRSLATINLFFSRIISEYQTRFTKHTNKFIRTYSFFSEEIESMIKSFLGENTEDTIKDDGTNITSSDNINEIFTDIIDNLTLTLPSPNISPDKSQMEELDARINLINNVANAVYPDQIADSEHQETIATIRATVISDAIMKYIELFGTSMAINLPNLDEGLFKNTMFNKQTLLNIKRMLDSAKSVSEGGGVEPPPDDSGEGEDDSMSF